MSLTNSTTSLKPFRTVDDYEVINQFTYSGTFPVDKGTLVKVGGDGWFSNDDLHALLGDIGSDTPNTVSERWGVPAQVLYAGSGDFNAVLGMLLYDGRETDENSEPLRFNPRKAAEMNVFVSGQACPILARGVVLYSGTQNGNPSVGAAAYVSGNGQISIAQPAGATKIGKFLGKKDNLGFALLKLEL